MKRIGTLWLGFAAMMALAPAHAGPDAVANYIMDEPASLMDIGMLRLEKRLDGAAWARYDWDSNTFLLWTYRPAADGDPGAQERTCAEWISEIRSLAAISDETGKPYGEFSGFAYMFTHTGFVRKNQPEDLLEQTDRMFQLKCFGGGEHIEAPLLGTGYSVARRPK